MPAKEFTVDFRVVHRDVLRIPKGVFGVNLGVADHHIAAVLESIVAVMNIVGDINVGRMHEEIIGMIGRHVPEFDIAAVPKRFHRVGEFYLLEVDIFHVAEHLRRIDSGVLHAHIAGAGRKAAALKRHMFGVPEGVFAFEEAVSGGDVFHVLQGGFARVNDNVVEFRAAERKKRPLTAVFDILEDLHFLSCFNGEAGPKKTMPASVWGIVGQRI